jgi:hypothetical protein
MESVIDWQNPFTSPGPRSLDLQQEKGSRFIKPFRPEEIAPAIKLCK